MPKLNYNLAPRVAVNDPTSSVARIAFSGFIDAANYERFERALGAALAVEARYLIVDLKDVRYINSTGISALLRTQDGFETRGGGICLVGVTRDVLLSLDALGVPKLVPLQETLDAALDLVASAARSGSRLRPDARSVERAGGTALARRSEARAPGVKRTVVVVFPSENRFTSVLRKRFLRHVRSDYTLLSSATQALDAFERLRPDLMVVDDRCDPDNLLVERLKLHPERSLTSIVKSYSRNADVRGSLDFKIWENDFLVDPYPVDELFLLTESELDRVPRDRSDFLQQVHFEFRGLPQNLDRAHALLDRILRDVLSSEDDRTTFAAALREGIDNAVRHGNQSMTERHVDVNCIVEKSKITVSIEDEGAGFDYAWYLDRVRGREAFEEAKRRILREGIRGGLGILLMSRCADLIGYEGRGNILRLEKRRV
jgi:anti-anti-sigma factor